MKTMQILLQELDACSEAKIWAQNKTIEEIVETCHRGDWLLWLAKKMDLPLKPLTLAKARCARTVIHLMKDQRSIDAVNIAEKFGLTDEVSLDDLRNASRAAAYAAAAAAADVAAADAVAAVAAAVAAVAAADAVAADAADARTKNQKQTADICRETFGTMLIELVNAALQN